MTEKNQTKSVREARAKARMMARGGEATYRQALDMVARQAGHAHWNDLIAKTESVDAPPDANECRKRPVARRRSRGPIAALIDLASVDDNPSPGYASFLIKNGTTVLLLGMAGELVLLRVGVSGHDADGIIPVAMAMLFVFISCVSLSVAHYIGAIRTIARRRRIRRDARRSEQPA